VCTLILAWRVFEDAPIAVAANRDELVDRPSSPPAVSDGALRYVAPRDEEAGGTWIGVNERGVFVGITNRRTDVEGERSRGRLVLDALAEPTAADAVAAVEREVGERTYAGFNLVIADAADAALLEWDGDLARTDFDPGVHVVVNDGFDDGDEKSRRIRDAARPEPDESAAGWRERVTPVLRDHDLGACVHRDGFGTRSSSLVTVGDGGVGWWFADGPPCETDHRRVEDSL
jgi:uncharacterized protein with NRDE domain